MSYLYRLDGITPTLCTKPNLAPLMAKAKEATSVVGTLKEVDAGKGRAFILFGDNVDDDKRAQYLLHLGIGAPPQLHLADNP